MKTQGNISNQRRSKSPGAPLQATHLLAPMRMGIRRRSWDPSDAHNAAAVDSLVSKLPPPPPRATKTYTSSLSSGSSGSGSAAANAATASGALIPQSSPLIPSTPAPSQRKLSFSLAVWAPSPSPPVSPSMPPLALSLSKSNTLPPLPPLKMPDSVSELTLDSFVSLYDNILPSNSGLPMELWIRIMCFIPNLENWSRVNRSTNFLLKDLQVRQLWLMGRYGVKLSLYGLLMHYPLLRNDTLVRMLVNGGANIPRFLVQIAFDDFSKGLLATGPATYLDFLVIEYCRKRDRTASRPSAEDSADASDGYLLPNGLRTNLDLHAAEALFQAKDSSLFEMYMNEGSAESMTKIRKLILEEQFIPILESSPTSLFRIFQLSQMDMTLFDAMIRKNGFKVAKVNDDVLRRVIATSTHSPFPAASTPNTAKNRPALTCYLNRGFRLSPKLAKSVLMDCANSSDLPKILHTVATHLQYRQIRRIALEIATEMLGPGGMSFTPAMLDHFLDARPISLLNAQDLQRALVGNEDGAVSDKIPYTTRCYEQANPQKVWHWVLRRFGVGHALTAYCFDDLLQWLGDLSTRAEYASGKLSGINSAGNNSKRATTDGTSGGPGMSSGISSTEENPFNSHVAPFVEAGILVLPRHVQFLAKSARCKKAAPMPAVILGLAMKSVLRRRESVPDSLETRGRTNVDPPELFVNQPQATNLYRGVSRDSAATAAPPSLMNTRGGSNAAESGQRTRISFAEHPPTEQQQRQNYTYPSHSQKNGLLTVPDTDLRFSVVELDASSSDTLIEPNYSDVARPFMTFDNEVALWIEAIRSMFADIPTVRAIKLADAEWFKEWRLESEAQEKKELAQIGLPMKKSWSSGGLGKRRSEFGAGWWDMLVGIGGGGMSNKVKALGSRTSGRPGRFLNISEDMLVKLTALQKGKSH
ncbi:hypothetical protein BJ741DRAFT_587065 [Chytriomyces cf. hyalinus JEL632]|nr:hypothetical protein BJ741DRAFT_587065 [Chytriomyces cf. hyalinus JEL632]